MERFDLVESWLTSVDYEHSGSRNTRDRYRRDFTRFAQFIGRNPQEILDDYNSRKEEKVLRREYARYFQAWIGNLVNSGYSPNSVINMVAAAKSFFKHNDLPLGHVSTRQPEVVFHNRDITKEEIAKIISASSPRGKAFFAIMAQSGLRPFTVCLLKLKHLPELEKGTIPCVIKVPKEIAKGKYADYCTFIGEEAVKFLRDYLTTRTGLTPESYLLTQQGTDEPMTKNSISAVFRRTANQLKKSGAMSFEQKESGKPAEIRLYSLRKWFRRQAAQAGFENVDYMMGHKGQGVDSYYRPNDPEFYRQVYAEKAMPQLRIDAMAPTETEKAIDEQARQIEELKMELEQLKTVYDLEHKDRVKAEQAVTVINEGEKQKAEKATVWIDGKKFNALLFPEEEKP